MALPTYEFTEPKVTTSSTGLSQNMFKDDLTFTFEAKDVHVTDPEEIGKVLAVLDKAVSEVKKAWQKELSASA
jgi:hypothetical protein